MDQPQRQRVHAAIVRLANGDREAFTFVFEELWPELLAFVRRVVPSLPDAEDVAQQALMKVFFRISEFDTRRDGVTWAFGIAAYEIKTLRRKTERRREVAEIPHQTADSARSPEQSVLDEEVDRTLSAALAELSTADQAALVLNGPSPAGITNAAERKRRQRALERLRAIWRRLYA